VHRFVEIYSKISCNENPTYSRKSLSLPLESIVDVRPSFGLILKMVSTKRLLPKFLANLVKVNYYAGEQKPIYELQGCLTSLLLSEIDTPFLQKLTKRCKTEQTTIHGALQAASIKALTQFVPSTFVIGIGSAIDLRSHAKIPLNKHHVGEWVTGVDLYFKEPLPEFWKLAREARERLVKKTQHGIELAGMLDYIPKEKWELFWTRQQSMNTNGKSSTLHISNLGIWEAPTYFGNTKMLGCIFAQCNSAVGPLVQMDLVTFNEKLQLSVSYNPTLITQQRIQQFVNNIKQQLQLALM